jgi:hypothetical protein
VHPEDVRGVDGERAVNIDVDLWQTSCIVEIVEGVDNLLCAAHTEGRDDEFSLLFNAGTVHHPEQFLVRLFQCRMEPVAVG